MVFDPWESTRQLPSSSSSSSEIDDDPSSFLSHKEELFVTEYIIDFNGPRAASEAGYHILHHENLLRLPHIKRAVRERISDRRSYIPSFQDRANRVIQELSHIAYSNPSDLFDGEGYLRDIKTLPQHIARSISSVEVIRRGYGPIDKKKDGDIVGVEPDTDDGTDSTDVTEYIYKIRQHDKTKALTLLCKHFGIANERVEWTGPDGGPIQVESSINLSIFPLWLRQMMMIVSNGGGISEEVERLVSQEVERRFTEMDRLMVDENRDSNGDSDKVIEMDRSNYHETINVDNDYGKSLFTKGLGCGPFDTER